MDRLNQLRGEAGDSTLDTSSPPSEAFMSANESSSKYFSLLDVDSTFSISPSKDASGTSDPVRSITTDAGIISSLSPIPKSDVDTFKIGKHIEAANILSGGVNIFDDNDNSYDGDELIIDDNVTSEEEKSNAGVKLSEGAELPLEKTEETMVEAMDETDGIPSKDTEVVLQIDGKNVDAIDIGNGLYLYRKAGQEELAAVQIVHDDLQQASFKFLKVRENTEGNLEVYEEIEVEIPKEVPTKDGTVTDKSGHVPIKDISKVINEPSCNKVIDKVNKVPKIESNSSCALVSDPSSDSQSEVNLNGKMMKFNESRKSPLIGTFTPMTYHSTPNKDGIPLTKTMVDQQLHPSRHSDNIKKTIEVNTETSKPRILETPLKPVKLNDTVKIKKCNSSVAMTKEDTIHIDVSEKLTETEAIITDSNEGIKCVTSDQAKNNSEPNPVDAAEKKSSTDDDKYIGDSLEEHEINAEEAVQCEIEIKSSDISEEIKGTTNEINPQKMSTDVNEKPTKFQKKQFHVQNKEKESSVNENLADNKSVDKIVNDNKAEINRNIDNDKNNIIENLLVSDNSFNKVEKTEKTVCDDALTKKLNLQLNEKVEATQEVSPLVNQDAYINRLKSSPINEVQIFSENIIENKKGQEIINDDLIVSCTNSIAIREPITNKTVPISTKESKSVKDKLDNCEDMTKPSLECDNTGASLSNDEVVFSKLQDTEVINTNVKAKVDKQNENITFNKDMNDIVVDNSIKQKTNTTETCSTEAEYSIDSVPTQRQDPALPSTGNADISCCTIPNKDTTIKQSVHNDKLIEARKEIPINKREAAKQNSAVPFGKWTEANRQEFLNKIKESKVPSNVSNTNQIKQTNDLNRRDILKKFDSQRNSTIAVPVKVSDFSSIPKFSTKTDTAAFVNKSVTQQSNPPKSKVPSSKTLIPSVKHKSSISKKPVKTESLNTEILQSRVINSQDLIDKTIEGIINRAIKIKPISDHVKEQKTIHTVENPKNALPLPGSLDDIEMKMNELHGISFAERPVKDLPPTNRDSKKYKSEKLIVNINSNIPNLLPFKAKDSQKVLKETMQDDSSGEEVIEHEPITGDIDNSNQNLISLLSSNEKPSIEIKKDAIITEKDFDKFARRNSKTYENCLTVNFDNKEQHNVIQTIVEKETSAKKMSRNELMLAESKAKSSSKQSSIVRQNNQPSKIQSLKSVSEDDLYNKNYQSKVQIAYQSALTDKRNRECPFTIIEDKPVKVVYMDTNTEFSATQLNIQGKELSPSKPSKTESDLFIHSVSDSMDSDILDVSSDTKTQEETKSKSKHQRKQVLTPVKEEPEIQLIEPSDLGFKVSPTKKRKTEERTERNSKNVVPKKSYLLNRSTIVEDHMSKQDEPKKIFKETNNRNETFAGRSNAISAIDNLVKAAELIETQSENNSSNVMTNQATDISQNTPVKRGRGRPRKYPLPAPGSNTDKPLSPQKKPRLIDAKVNKTYTDSDESSDGEIIKENWTMGKINENIVCPICDKLFRSENVVFKHVKHCTGPSPNRSDSDKRSPRRLRNSHESDTKLRDSGSDTDFDDEEKLINHKSNNIVSKSINDSDDVIVIEDITKEKLDDKVSHSECKKAIRKMKPQHNVNNLICEFCGKTFRQLSYLVSHKLQHKNQDSKKSERDYGSNKSVFSCEVCKKEFRKLHHLVQHRIIHNSSSVTSRLIRNTSTEQKETIKSQNDDASAGFRCEPCDKSFRKLHHLVEHRETHDGINKKGTTSNSQTAVETSKTLLVHHCDICKKVFKKLQDLLEHNELHYETSSEKSDDKSVKSSLSTKDIIHECSLCYMVFPNEHSLNKHAVICLRKKKQSAAKQAAKKAAEGETGGDDDSKIVENSSPDIDTIIDSPKIEDSEVTEQPIETSENVLPNNQGGEELEYTEDIIIEEQTEEKPKPSTLDVMPKKRHSNVAEKVKVTDDVDIPAKIKKIEDTECITISDTPIYKKKTLNKDKVAFTVAKQHATINMPLPIVDNSSDDDEVRYMLNPNFKKEHSIEKKIFMTIRSLKRNSLQIERPNSKDLVKRRVSLQHPPKMPRLKAKPVEIGPRKPSVEINVKDSTTGAAISIDSDDSDVKYSFPEKVDPETSSKPVEKKVKRQPLAAKRKSLTSIAKRKSLGKSTISTNKPKKRATEVEHRCDCGQLFSSAALLSRHTTLAHTPPRIRKRRSPPPDMQPNTKPPTKPAPKPNIKPNKPTNSPKTQPKKPKSVTNSNKTNVGVPETSRKSSVNTRKSSVNDTKASSDAKCEFNFKLLRSSKRGVPESVRTVFDKVKK